MSRQVARTRIKEFPTVSGTFYRELDGVVVTDSVAHAWDFHRCQDIAGKYTAHGHHIVDHPLIVTHISRNEVQGMTGTYQNGTFIARYKNWPTSYARLTEPAHLEVAGVPDLNADALRVLAMTNPGRNGPGSWGETLGDIGELPKLLHKAGGSFLKRAANGKLTWDWAILPVFEDLLRLFDIQRDIERRLRELESLQKKGGLRRKVELGRYSASSGPGSITTFESNYAVVRGFTTRITEIHRWGTVRWKIPDGMSLPPLPPDVLRGWARRHVLGLNPDLGLLWETIPFSFLFDWWRNVGNWLDAQNRSLPAEPSDVCIMTHYRTKQVMTVSERTPWVTGGGGLLIRETKRRDIVSGLPPVLSSQGPKLGPGQLTNLGAMLVKYSKL